MNNQLKRLFVFIFTLLFSIGSFAEDNVPHVEVVTKAWVGSQSAEDEPVYAPTEQVILYIEVSTNSWFTAGTRIPSIEIPDVMVKQRNPFAINSTEREKGQTWSRQLWEIVLYPQKSGEFAIPPVTLDVQVANLKGSSQKATLETKPLSFKVQLPSAELSNNDWFAASDVEVDQDWDIVSQDDLKVGDSVTRTIHIKAEDTLSVLLPNPMQEKVTDFWQVYPEPSDLNDTQTRGLYISTRVDSHTYILQQGGDMVWPSYDILWWNAKQQRVERLTIEGKTIHVKHTLSSWLKAYAVQLIIVGLVLVGVICFAYFLRRYYQTHPRPQWVEFSLSLVRNEWSTIRVLVYKKLRSNTNSVTIMDAREGALWRDNAKLIQSDTPKRNGAIYLWRKLKRKTGIRLSIPDALPDLKNNKNNIFK